MPTGDRQQGIIEVGDLVERDIDGVWFLSEVLAVRDEGRGPRGNWSTKLYDLKYLDDNNVESEVPGDEIRRVFREGTSEKLVHRLPAKVDRLTTGADGGGCRERSAEEAVDDVANDQEESRGSSRASVVGPKVTIHSSSGTFDAGEDGTATAYIINGPETNVAAGSGLRGIRWLKG